MAAKKLFRVREVGEECAGLAVARGEKTLSRWNQEDLYAPKVSFLLNAVAVRQSSDKDRGPCVRDGRQACIALESCS